MLKNLSARDMTMGSPSRGATSARISPLPVVEYTTKRPAARALPSSELTDGNDATHAGRGGQITDVRSRTRNADVAGSTVTGVSSGSSGGAGCASAAGAPTSRSPPAAASVTTIARTLSRRAAATDGVRRPTDPDEVRRPTVPDEV